MTISEPSKLQPALIGGVFLGLTSALPLLGCANVACCLLVVGGGVISSYYYLKDFPAGLQADYGSSVGLGMLTGAIGAGVWALVEIPITMISARLGARIGLERLQEALQNADLPPEFRNLLTTAMAGTALAVGAFILGAIMKLIIAVIFATIGALIGFAIFQRKPPVTPAQAYTPPPPSTAPPPSPPGPGDSGASPE